MIPRVTFDDLYPRAEDDETPVCGIVLLRSVAPRACWVCGRPTHWLSEPFEAHVCSAICDSIGWQRYWDAEVAANCAPSTAVYLLMRSKTAPPWETDRGRQVSTRFNRSASFTSFQIGAPNPLHV